MHTGGGPGCKKLVAAQAVPNPELLIRSVGKAVDNFWKSTGTEQRLREHFFGFKFPEWG
jgi:hypothetical protein